MKTLFNLIIVFCLGLISCGTPQKTADSIPAVPDSVNYTKILVALNEAVENEESAESYFQRARINLKIKTSAQALEDIEKAIRKDNSQPKYYLLRAEIQQAAFKTDQALADAEQAKTLQLENPELFTLLGELYFQKKQFPASIQHLDKALSLAPFNAKAWFWKGKTALATFDTVQAISHFKTTLQHQPEFYEAYAQLNLIYNGLYDFTTARNYALAGLKQDPDHARLRYQLAETCRFTIRNLQDLNRIDSAKANYLYAVAKDSSLFRAYYETAYISFQQKNYPQALLYFEKVKNKKKRLPFAFTELLAMCYDFTGKWQEALDEYANVISQDIFNRNERALERYEQIKNYLAAQKYRAYADSMARLYPELYAPKPQKQEPLIKLLPLKPREIIIK